METTLISENLERPYTVGRTTPGVLEEFLSEINTEQDRLALVIPLMSYNWDDLLSQLPETGSWMIYRMFMKEHVRELANTIHDFGRYIISLSAWESVLKKMAPEDKLDFLIEFISPLATLALNMPYVLRSRFFYSIAHLSHQANRTCQNPWVDDLPPNKDINFKKAGKFAGGWEKYDCLKQALEKISNQEYQDATHDFRNSYTHRYSPEIEVGLTDLGTRTVKGKTVSYVIGSTPPLMLCEIVPLLLEQHSFCVDAYEKYRNLINEQVVEISKMGD